MSGWNIATIIREVCILTIEIIVSRRWLLLRCSTKEVTLRVVRGSAAVMKLGLISYQVKSSLVCQTGCHLHSGGIGSNRVTYLRWVWGLSASWETILTCKRIVPFVLAALIAGAPNYRVHLWWLVAVSRVIKSLSNGWKPVAARTTLLLVQYFMVTAPREYFVLLCSYVSTSVRGYGCLLLWQRCVWLVAIVN